MSLLDCKQGSIGLNFIITCRKCKTVLGSTSNPKGTQLLCSPCGDDAARSRTPEEIERQVERSRKDFTNRMLAQAGLSFKI